MARYDDTEGIIFHCRRHEWVKHGTCCPDHLHPEYSYLNHTLTLFENGLNFDKILRDAGITPSGSRLYKVHVLSNLMFSSYVG